MLKQQTRSSTTIRRHKWISLKHITLVQIGLLTLVETCSSALFIQVDPSSIYLIQNCPQVSSNPLLFLHSSRIWNSTRFILRILAEFSRFEIQLLHDAWMSGLDIHLLCPKEDSRLGRLESKNVVLHMAMMAWEPLNISGQIHISEWVNSGKKSD